MVTIPASCLSGDNPLIADVTNTQWDRAFDPDGFHWDYTDDDRQRVAGDEVDLFQVP